MTLRRKFLINTPEYNFVDKLYYINLDYRKDRKEHIEKELRKLNPIGDKIYRIPGIFHEIGALGCGLSHIKALDHAIENNYQRIAIFEDDFKFFDKKSVKNLHFFSQKLQNFDKNFSIGVLARNLQKPLLDTSDEYIKEGTRNPNCLGLYCTTSFF